MHFAWSWERNLCINLLILTRGWDPLTTIRWEVVLILHGKYCIIFGFCRLLFLKFSSLHLMSSENYWKMQVWSKRVLINTLHVKLQFVLMVLSSGGRRTWRNWTRWWSVLKDTWIYLASWREYLIFLAFPFCVETIRCFFFFQINSLSCRLSLKNVLSIEMKNSKLAGLTALSKHSYVVLCYFSYKIL